MYQVIGTRGSRAFRVLWMLEELGQPYEHSPAKPQSEAVRTVSPAGKVPVLVADGTVLTDSVAIMTYLGDKHGALSYTAGTLDRARQDALTQQVTADIDALLWMAARHSFVLPEERRVPAIKDSLKWEYTRNLDRLAEALQGPFLMGEMMTVPDIVLAHCLTWAEAAKFPAPGDALVGFRARMQARKAFETVAALP
jgi:glutathione S-transferase